MSSIIAFNSRVSAAVNVRHIGFEYHISALHLRLRIWEEIHVLYLNSVKYGQQRRYDISERIAYSTQTKRPSVSELLRLFTLENHEIEWAISVVASMRTRHGILCLFRVFQTLGGFISPRDIPSSIVSHISQQLQYDLQFAESFNYAIRTLRRHQDLVRRLLGVSE